MADERTDFPTISAQGEIDVVSSRPLAAQLADLAGQAGGAVLDLTQVTLIDSVGLGVVLKAAGRFQRQDKTLVLVAPPDTPARSILDFAGTDGRVTVVDSADEAASVLT